jgi:hypothetical protein
MLLRQVPGAKHREPTPEVAEAVAAVRRYFEGEETDFFQVQTRSRRAGPVLRAHLCPTSMGRLTLNILLSFAQFEREVIGERIRDKDRRLKTKGMWMGGVPPLYHRDEMDLMM